MSEQKLKFEINVPREIILKSDGEYQPESEKVRYQVEGGLVMELDSDTAWKLNQIGIVPGERFFVCKRWNGERRQHPRWDVWLSPEAEKARALAEAPGMRLCGNVPTPVSGYQIPVHEFTDASPIGVDTGGLPPGTQAAADYVAQEKIQRLQSLPPAARVRELVNLPLSEQLRLSAIAAAPKPAALPEKPAPIPDSAAPARMAPDVRQFSEQEIPLPPEPPANGTYGPRPVRKRQPGGQPVVRISANVAFREILRFVKAGLQAENLMLGDGAFQDLVSTVYISASNQGLIGAWEADDASAR